MVVRRGMMDGGMVETRWGRKVVRMGIVDGGMMERRLGGW